MKIALHAGESAEALQFMQQMGLGYVVSGAPDSPSGVVDDTDWGHKGRAFDLGYLQAVVQTLESH